MYNLISVSARESRLTLRPLKLTSDPQTPTLTCALWAQSNTLHPQTAQGGIRQNIHIHTHGSLSVRDCPGCVGDWFCKLIGFWGCHSWTSGKSISYWQLNESKWNFNPPFSLGLITWKDETETKKGLLHVSTKRFYITIESSPCAVFDFMFNFKILKLLLLKIKNKQT